MSELRPILGDDPTEDEKRILRSARLDVPPRSGRGRTVAAMGLAAALATAGTSGASAASAGAGFMVKWMAIGALGGTIALGASGGLTPLVRGFERGGAPAGAPLPARPARRLPRRAVPEVLTATQALDETPLAPDGVAEGARAPAPSGAAPAAPAARPAPAAPHSRAAEPSTAPATMSANPAIAPPAGDATLAAEVDALDEARRALASENTEEAGRILDVYDRRFPRRRLGPEATVLRIEVLVAQGQLGQAAQLGDELLASQPEGAYAQHVRSLLSGVRR